MSRYRRAKIEGGIFFFTLALADRSSDLLVRKDAGELYDYVRPLATVEPTAIFFTLPVDTSFGFSDIIDLQAALEKRLSARRDTLIYSLGAQTNRSFDNGSFGRSRW